jgi:Uma2 family endonuclease
MALMRAGRPRVSYADLEDMADDGRRYEIVDGELFDVTPAPSPLHQRVSKRLQRQLEAYFEAAQRGEVFNAPVDVILTPHDVFEPDIVLVTDGSQVSGRAIEGVPALLVEVLSPSTTAYDRTTKGRRYAALAIPHYWIVDPVGRRIECYRWEKGTHHLVAEGGASGVLRHPDFEGLVVDLDAIWR